MTKQTTMAGEQDGTLSRRALNRALLARQMLLERTECTTLDAISHLVGMQAQSAQAPYVGLWTRLRNFEPGELSDLIEKRLAVRMLVMRTTIHLVTDADALRLRPLLQTVLERGFLTGSPFGKKIAGIDMASVLEQGRLLLAEKPRSNVELAAALGPLWPDFDAESIGHAVRLLLPLVQRPPRGLWNQSGQPVWALLQGWLDRPLDEAYPIDELVLRYLGAFGPASVMDFQAWCWLTRQAEVFERLRPRLVSFRDEAGRELFDLPTAPRPPEDCEAPVRFIPEYDNLLLSHADRSRVVSEAQLKAVFSKGALLVDGFVAGAWKADRAKATAVLQIELFGKLSKTDTKAVEAEAGGLLTFLAAAAKARTIRFV